VTTANVAGTNKEALASDTSGKALVAQTVLDASGSNPNPKAISVQTIMAVAAANPGTLAKPIQTIMETIRIGTVDVTVVNNVTLQVGIGNSAVIFNDRLKATSTQIADSGILYTIVTPPSQGYFLVNGVQQSTFTQGQIDAGLVLYVSNKLAYRYEYEARDTILFTDETPNREQAANLVEYFSSGSTVTADSFVFTFSADVVTPPGNSTFNIQLINEGFVVNNALIPGEDGMLEMPVESELFEMPLESETMEMWS
jgi:hypothetical protein